MFPAKSIIVVVLVTFTDVVLTLPYPNCNPCPKITHMAIPCESVIAVKETCAPIMPVKCCEQLILPPKAVEVPCGLGYSSVAVPVVAEAYSERFFTNGVDELVYVSEALIPVSPPCSCIKLATPVCQEWSPLLQPIIL
ncbi:unnamed protein product [Colias eurytheme]|nr:unnamed protein product [Colias eurytheme]